MSNKPNHRRMEERRPEHGPTYEGWGAGCNNTHVARSRKKWKRRAVRTERRTGQTTAKWNGTKRVLPDE